MSDAAAILPGGEELITRVRQEIVTPETTRIRWALGYLFVPGLAPLWDTLEASAATEIHLLIGNTAGVLTDEQRVAAADEAAAAQQGATGIAPELDVAAGARAERGRIVAATANALRENLRNSVSRTPENARLLLGFAQGVAQSRVRVRIYPEGRLHAKAYLFERAGDTSSTAIVGSSNLTLPSPGNPTELNVLLKQDAEFASVSAWFDRLWDGSQDFGRELVTELSGAWPLGAE